MEKPSGRALIRRPTNVPARADTSKTDALLVRARAALVPPPPQQPAIEMELREPLHAAVGRKAGDAVAALGNGFRRVGRWVGHAAEHARGMLGDALIPIMPFAGFVAVLTHLKCHLNLEPPGQNRWSQDLDDPPAPDLIPLPEFPTWVLPQQLGAALLFASLAAIVVSFWIVGSGNPLLGLRRHAAALYGVTITPMSVIGLALLIIKVPAEWSLLLTLLVASCLLFGTGVAGIFFWRRYNRPAAASR